MICNQKYAQRIYGVYALVPLPTPHYQSFVTATIKVNCTPKVGHKTFGVQFKVRPPHYYFEKFHVTSQVARAHRSKML